MDNDFRLFATFTKKDDDKRIVEGFATTEAVDSQGEVVKLSAIEKALPGYMKYANVREMHQWSAVGKTIATKTDDKKKGLWIRAKIVDDQAWQKCKEKVYSAFSIGGKILKKIGNVIHELDLNEISLVDRPANPQAVFSLVKIKEGGVMEKQMPMPEAPYGMDSSEQPKFAGIKIADRLIAMTETLTNLIAQCEEMGRPTAHIQRILKYVKRAAMFELEQEKDAVEKVLKEKEQADSTKVNQLKGVVDKFVKSLVMQPNWAKSYFNELKANL